MKDFASDVMQISYKEIMIFWGITEDAARKRLNLIRSSLGKNRFQRLSKIQYCKAEDITLEEFNQVYNQRMNLPYKKTA